MNMPLSNIKYKITTKRGLKPDTFKNYIEYVFNNFLEDEAKILVNNFIGNLGLKYTRNSKGFICKTYDCAMCIWTEAIKHKRNITIDSNNDVYIIKETDVTRNFSDNTSINRLNY